MAWCKGDGIYSDEIYNHGISSAGASYQQDDYNSFVIQPMLLGIMTVCAHTHSPLAVHAPLILVRAPIRLDTVVAAATLPYPQARK